MRAWEMKVLLERTHTLAKHGPSASPAVVLPPPSSLLSHF